MERRNGTDYSFVLVCLIVNLSICLSLFLYLQADSGCWWYHVVFGISVLSLLTFMFAFAFRYLSCGKKNCSEELERTIAELQRQISDLCRKNINR